MKMTCQLLKAAALIRMVDNIVTGTVEVNHNRQLAFKVLLRNDTVSTFNDVMHLFVNLVLLL
jgi:hypothetical protein